MIEERGYGLLFLPPYSLNLDPVEEAFSKVKNILRKFAARTKETPVEAIGGAPNAVNSKDARGSFDHCGYRSLVQHLRTLLS